MNTNNWQMYIEGKSNHLFVYVYLMKFKKEHASEIFDNYIVRYEQKNFKKIIVMFCDKGVPGEFLSMFRKNINRKCTRHLLKGISYIEATFDYIKNIKILNNPITIS
ncbi:MAG TPA: hypothetical protein VGK25_12325 [Ignavibacteria bacterium]